MEKFLRRRMGIRLAGVGGALVLALTIAALGSSSAGASAISRSRSHGSSATKHLKLLFLSFAVNNSYDAPMLSAAKAEAAKLNASLTVDDANNSPTTQYSQFQDAITSGGYNGIITQPIESTNLVPLVSKAVKKGIKVVNVDQVMGPSYKTSAVQVKGLSGNVTFNPWALGTSFGNLAVEACKAKKLNPCKIGYLYDIQASTLDVAIHGAFVAALKSDPHASIVDTGQDEFTPSVGETAVQTMLTAQPSINMIAGSDQGIEGAADDTSRPKHVVLVGFGASAAGIKGVKAGTWYGTVAQDPASEGSDGVETLVNAIRYDKNYAGYNPLTSLPNDGIVTKSDASEFKGQWPG